MRNRTMALAWAAVLAMAAASSAGITLYTTPPELLPQKVAGKSLYRFILRAICDNGNINTLTNPMLYGGTLVQNGVTYTSPGMVHQCQANGGAYRTKLEADINAGLASSDEPWGSMFGWTAEQTAADTHLLMWPSSEWLLSFGSNALKENSITGTVNAFGYNATGTDGTVKSGMGTWAKTNSLAAYDYTLAIANDMSKTPPEYHDGPTMDLMQVVLERGTCVFFSGRVLGANVAPVEFKDVILPILDPEPSAVVMLLMGGACLVACCWWRARRRAAQSGLSSPTYIVRQAGRPDARHGFTANVSGKGATI